ncbi:DUF2817 domain-containing protein [Caballeronia choica]|uniref:DUF2817 domain-containing protein n=1 Tax=Caballeronia choica TaxID=326476 RepID=UPI000AEC4504|nr:DUF2817 domain-containing protein [Caballeronia choica]
MLDALPDTHLMQFVVESGTYAEERLLEALRDDHWLHLHGDLQDACGKQISRALFDAFLPADDDRRHIAWRRTRQSGSAH